MFWTDFRERGEEVEELHDLLSLSADVAVERRGDQRVLDFHVILRAKLALAQRFAVLLRDAGDRRG